MLSVLNWMVIFYALGYWVKVRDEKRIWVSWGGTFPRLAQWEILEK
jgi:hypothetical protein